jgi:fluoride exporter
VSVQHIDFMTRFLLVCLGGAFGSGARYLVSIGAVALLGIGFPYGTLIVNVTGSFLVALLMHVGLATEMLSPELRLMLTTGVMGGFTTYSTFNYETLAYFREGAWGIAVLNVVLTLVACLGAGVAGMAVGRLIFGR